MSRGQWPSLQSGVCPVASQPEKQPKPCLLLMVEVPVSSLLAFLSQTVEGRGGQGQGLSSCGRKESLRSSLGTVEMCKEGQNRVISVIVVIRSVLRHCLIGLTLLCASEVLA